MEICQKCLEHGLDRTLHFKIHVVYLVVTMIRELSEKAWNIHYNKYYYYINSIHKLNIDIY